MQASANQAWRRRPFCSQISAVSATASAADHSSVPAIWRFNLINLSSVQFAFESSRSKSRIAFRASPSVTPLPRKRSSSRCRRAMTCRSSSRTSSPGAAAAPKSAAMRSNNSRHSGLCWLCASRTLTAHFAAPKGLRSVKTWNRSFFPRKTCVCVVSCQPPTAVPALPALLFSGVEAVEAPESTGAQLSTSLLSPPLLSLSASLLPSSSPLLACTSAVVLPLGACCTPRRRPFHFSIS
mmetsp:Transcript_77924/g.215391  ORF Transcript_77924/g.215391 Transcript_77924/m.215391 type:complete len:238 (+) Transcript_77924:894-1607(+)